MNESNTSFNIGASSTEAASTDWMKVTLLCLSSSLMLLLHSVCTVCRNWVPELRTEHLLVDWLEIR